VGSYSELADPAHGAQLIEAATQALIQEFNAFVSEQAR
jgi:hypothetical protein